ncbi:MAG: Na+:solute symporter [Sedimentisphaerales bacterium]|nr:Na+:solute symporter [Sedimentisphaerales bacterium]
MQLQPIDIGIIVGYIGVIMIAGFAMSKLASRNLESYFLGGHAVPWYVLGVANASGMFDITGTMWLVMTIFVYGLRGVFLPWVWPVFNQVFLMVFLAVWLRRSGVMTGAEWITTRFGESKGARLSHISVVIFAIVSVIGFLAYAFKGIGKFSGILLPWNLSDNQYAMILMGVTSLYVIFGGMLSVTVTDVIQYILMTISSIFIAVIAFRQTTAEQINAAVPDGWHNLLFGWKLNLDWSQHIPQINEQLANDGWELFGIVFMIVLFKGILNSAAGPAPNYDMQRVLSTRSPKEAAKMSGFVSVVLFMPRYLMIVGITLLGLVVFKDVTTQMEGGFDAEKVLPSVIEHLPAGLTGFVLAGLLAAFMSTFSATINAGASYVVNDLYKKHINPNAPAKRYVYASYICSVLILIVGIAFGMMTKSVNTVTQWIVNGLFGGYTAANILKWYWWRFNGFGYFSGMISGIVAAIFLPLPLVLRDQNLLWNLERNIALFPIILAISLAASVIATLLTKADDEEVLKRFYKQVRPWGFWGPIRAKVMQEDPSFRPNTAFGRDMTNVAVGIVWQLTLVLVPTYLLIRSYRNLGITIAVLIVTSIFLRFNWYDKLENE